MEVPVRIALTHGGFAVPCLTAWLRHHSAADCTDKSETSLVMICSFFSRSDITYSDSASGFGSLNETFFKINFTWSASLSSIERGNEPVKVYPVFSFETDI